MYLFTALSICVVFFKISVQLLNQVLRRPHEIVFTPKNEIYLFRWFVIPHNRFFNIYLHKFFKSDEERALHDHPWNSLSVILSGRYLEELPENVSNYVPEENKIDTKLVLRTPFKPIYREATIPHRVKLITNNLGKEMSVWTLFITGRKWREWGFWTKDGWVHNLNYDRVNGN